MLLDKDGVYAIINAEDKQGTAYIGSTLRTFQARWQRHRRMLTGGYHRNTHLQRAWDKYGTPAFVFAVLEVVDDPKAIITREQHWLDLWRTTLRVYNIGRVAANAMTGRHHTQQTRELLSKLLTGKPRRSGWHHTDDAKRRMSIAKAGRSLSSRHRRAIGKALKGRTVSQETRQKISQKALGNTRGAKPYPAFIHRDTGDVIEAGSNLTGVCKSMGLSPQYMGNVKNGTRKSHKGWVLLDTPETTR